MKRRILIIEDDPDAAQVMSDTLDGAGYGVLTSPDGEQGLEAAIQEQPDLIILDLMLPGRDGVDICRDLGASDATKSIPVIVVTARSELSVKLSSFMAGARRYICKPFDIDKLLDEVARVFRQTQASRETLGQSEPEQ